MAEVIRLEDRKGKPSFKPTGPLEAKILFFTGVRYERWAEAQPAGKRTDGSAKRKKH